MVRFVHSGDWQLGMRRHYLDEQAQGRFAQDRLDAVAAVGRLAADEDADFVLVAGDVFDDNQVDRRTVLRACEVLRGFPDVPVLLLPGNHDPYDTGSVLAGDDFREHCPPQVQVVVDATPVEVADGVELVGAPWPVKRPVRNPLLDVLDVLDELGPPDRLRVLLAHGNVDAVGGDFEQAGLLRLVDLEKAVANGLAHYVALGDRHSATEVGDTGRVWYAGAPEPTSHVEEDPGRALVVELTTDSAEVVRHRVGRWTFREGVFDVAGDEDLDAVLRWLDEPVDKPRTVARIALRGSLSLAQRTRLDDRLRNAAETYASLEEWDRHAALTTTPDDADLDAMDVGGFVAGAVDELRRAAAGRGEDAEVAGDALALLYRTVVHAGGTR